MQAEANAPDAKRSATRMLIGIVVVGVALRLGYAAVAGELGVTPATHYREHITLATRLLSEGTFGSPMTPEDPAPRPSAMFPPLYPLLVAGVYAVLGVESYAATLVLQAINALATSLAATVVFSVARRLGASSFAAAAGAAATAVNPVLILLTTRIWDAPIFVLGAAWAVRLTVAARPPRAGPRADVFFGVYLGALALLDPALTPVYPVLVLWRAVRRTPRPSAGSIVASTAWVLLGWAGVNAPWTLRNARVLGEASYVRNGFWQEVWFGVCPEADTGLQAAMKAHFPLQSAAARQRYLAEGETAYFADCRTRAIAAIREQPGRWAVLCARRAADFWFGTVASHDGGAQRWMPRGLRLAAAVFLTIETAAALAATMLTWRRRPDMRWLAGAVLVFSLLYAATHTEIRYRGPIEPLLAMLIFTAASAAPRRNASA
ncbi:MAG: hypothetical protein FLDDKLPJ_02750 [Phycisphaerae bacterium]|nr:hypothetical protein [Phycisphaerae bacterium]